MNRELTRMSKETIEADINTITIAYQGRPGSNSHAAARLFAERESFLTGSGTAFLPCVSSEGVCTALAYGQAGYGVMARRNSIAGTVGETAQALGEFDGVALLSSIVLPIHHCLFSCSPAVTLSSVMSVASHTQALAQTRKTVSKLLSCRKYTVRTVPDTALAAEQLRAGELFRDTAVICPKEAGLANGLFLLVENIEDEKGNETVFGLYSFSEPVF